MEVEKFSQYVKCEEIVATSLKNLTIVDCRIRTGKFMIRNENFKPVEEDVETLKKLLGEVSFDELQEGESGFVGDIFENCIPIVKDFLKEKGFSFETLGFHYYVMKKEEFKRKYVPASDNDDDVKYLDNLTADDVDVIQPHHAMNDEFIKGCIKYLPSSCIRDEETGKPIAWILRYMTSRTMGFLHVLEEYRRKGYAKKLVKDVLLKSLEYREDEYFKCHIDPNNISSQRLFEKLGFTKDPEKRYWILYNL